MTTLNAFESQFDDTDMTTFSETFQVPACNLDELRKHVDRLNRKAAKLKLAPITLTIGDSFKAEFVVPWSRDEEREIARMMSAGLAAPENKRVTLTAYQVTVTGQAPKLDGWRLVAVLDHLIGGAGTIVNVVPGETVNVEAYTSGKPVCDHCKTTRARKDTVLVRHDDGRELRVGKTCLKDFLGGHASPEVLAHSAQFLKQIREMAGGFGAVRDFSGRYHINTPVFLAYVAKEIRERGFVSRKMANEKNAGLDAANIANPVLSTADIASTTMSIVAEFQREGKAAPAHLIPTEADFATGKAALEWCKTMAGIGDFATNLRTLAKAELPEVEPRHLGLLAAGVNSYIKDQEIASTRVKYGESKHVGEVGKRFDLVLTVRKVRWFPGDYGGRYLVSFGDADGNLFTWWTGENLSDNVEPGKTFEVRGTVKKHEDYKGTKQTVLTRCVIGAERETTQPELKEE